MSNPPNDFNPRGEAADSQSARVRSRGSRSEALIAAAARGVRLKLTRETLLRGAALVAAFGWACGEGTAPPVPVVTVQIVVSQAVEVVPGGTQMLTVVPKDATGNALTDRLATWSSSDSTRVTVAAGLVTGVALGTATITATVEGHAATVDVKVKNGAVVSPAGTSFSVLSGAVAVAVPAGAVSQTTNITVEPAANAPPNPRLMPGTAFDFGPNGATFSQPITLTIKYDTANVASDSPENGLQLYEANGSSWRVVPGSSANLTAKTVTGAVSHFSTYAAMMQPRVETVTIGGDLSAMAVVTTRQLSATVKDNEGTTLTRPVFWSSSNPAVLSVDAETGVATAKVLGSVTVTASSEGKSGTATISVVPGPPSKILAFAGNNQSVTAGATAPVAPSVKVTDAGDNPIANVAVTFVVSTGGGTITGATTTTNASGIATVGSWTIGTVAGPNTLTATSPAISGASVTFQAVGGAGPPTTVTAFAGNNQTGTAGGNVGTPPSVRITDANGNFVSGFTVTFAPASGSGSVTGATVVSDASGIAAVGSWKLGSTPGPQSLTATASGLTGSPITFNATAVAPVPSTIAGYAGNNQTARPSFAVSTPPSVIVTDVAGIPVPGVAVTFAVTSGGGSITGATATTNGDGIAAVGSWTLGPDFGPNSLTASAGALSGSPVTFNATAASPPPSAIAINAGDGQTAFAGQPVAIPPSVKVTTVDGIGVAGVSVTFSIRSGGGTINGATSITNASGIATIGSWVLGIGGNSLFASVPGLSGDPVIFVALGTAEVQIVTFGDSNTDLGFQGTDPSAKVGSYVSSANPTIKLGANSPNSTLQLAGKIEARWRANSTTTIRAVNHGIAGTSTGTGTSILFAPNALQQVGGVTRFRGEVLGDAYPWSGGEPINSFYPNGAIQRVQAFKPRSSDFGYISMGTNDIGVGVSTTAIRNNLAIMIDDWTSIRGLSPSRLMITTIPPRQPSESTNIPELNSKIRALALAKGIRLVDISALVSTDDGRTWKDPTLHVTNDELHYAESVRDSIADQVVSIMLQLTP
ncbi:MAG: Ig-like domain-containing protein [Gemmatimonadaceae bacterium]|nr:Ig-like domain-containing protein [Gemmatimonadaceae bacterium]